MTRAEVMAAYGEAAVNLEIAQNKFNEAKRAVVEVLNAKEPTKEKAE